MSDSTGCVGVTQPQARGANTPRLPGGRSRCPHWWLEERCVCLGVSGSRLSRPRPLQDFLSTASPDVFRLFCLRSSYRSGELAGRPGCSSCAAPGSLWGPRNPGGVRPVPLGCCPRALRLGSGQKPEDASGSTVPALGRETPEPGPRPRLCSGTQVPSAPRGPESLSCGTCPPASRAGGPGTGPEPGALSTAPPLPRARGRVPFQPRRRVWGPRRSPLAGPLSRDLGPPGRGQCP